MFFVGKKIGIPRIVSNEIGATSASPFDIAWRDCRFPCKLRSQRSNSLSDSTALKLVSSRTAFNFRFQKDRYLNDCSCRIKWNRVELSIRLERIVIWCDTKEMEWIRDEIRSPRGAHILEYGKHSWERDINADRFHWIDSIHWIAIQYLLFCFLLDTISSPSRFPATKIVSNFSNF